jgi:hypothetical protein
MLPFGPPTHFEAADIPIFPSHHKNLLGLDPFPGEFGELCCLLLLIVGVVNNTIPAEDHV